MIFCTVTAANYLAYAKVLAASLKEHAKGCKFVLCLVEDEVHPAARFAGIDDVVLTKDLGIPGFQQLIANKNIYEFTMLIKPYLLLHLFDRYPSETKFVYLDADIRVYDSFDGLDKLLDRYSIILTPHRLEPQSTLNSVEEELVNLKDGSFQVGFLGLNKTSESRRFLKWWAARCLNYAVVDYGRGLFGDQKWLNLVPCFFKDVYILRDPGYHMASWNLSQRNLERTKNNQYTVNGRPLVFFHFSGIGEWLDKSIALHAANNEHVQGLVNQYIRDLHEMGHSELVKIPWDYEKILRYEERRRNAPVEVQPIQEVTAVREAAEDEPENDRPDSSAAPKKPIVSATMKIWHSLKKVVTGALSK